MARGSIRFAIVMAAFAATVYWADSSASVQPAAVHALQPAAQLAAWATAGVLRVLGFAVIRDGPALHDTGGFALQIDVGCMGFPLLALLLVAVSAYRAPTRRKLAGISGGIATLCALNLLRFVHLFYLGVHERAAFAFFHDIVWRVILVAALLALWFGWRRWASASIDALG